MQQKVAFKALVGSANYNLSTPESDKDYKVFVLPTFKDLYYSKVYTCSKVSEMVDEDYHDIRKLVNLFWKSNVNFVEVLFSSELTCSECDWIKDSIDQIFAMKNALAAMNLPYLYQACKGMYFSKSKYIEKGNMATQDLVKKFGYDCKSAMHAYRIVDFIERFAENRFTDFEGAMKYDEKDREFLLNIKIGGLTKDDFLKLMKDKMIVFEQLNEVYKKQPLKEEVKEHLENILYQLILENVIHELHR